MNYLSNLRRILVSLSFNCTFLNALVSCSADGKSIIVELDTTKLKGIIASNTSFKAIADDLTAIKPNVNIVSNSNLKTNIDVLATYRANIHIDVESGINVEIVGASANIVGNIKILSALTAVSEMLVKSALSIKADVDSVTSVKSGLNTPSLIDVSAIAQVVFSGSAKLKLFTEFAEMIAKIESQSDIVALAVALDTTIIRGSTNYVIDFDGTANGDVLDALISLYNLSSVSELKSTLNYLVKAYVSDYYSKTISGAFYGGTLEDAFYIVV